MSKEKLGSIRFSMVQSRCRLSYLFMPNNFLDFNEIESEIEERNRCPRLLLAKAIACLGWTKPSPDAPLVINLPGAGGVRGPLSSQNSGLRGFQLRLSIYSRL